MPGVLQRIHHLGYLVEDMEGVLELYGRTWGAELGFHRTISHRGLEIAWFNVGGNIVEFIRPLGERGPEAEFLRRHGPGLHHVAFLVQSIQEAVQTMGTEGTVPAVEVRPSDVGNWLVATLPRELTGGVITQLVEAPSTR